MQAAIESVKLKLIRVDGGTQMREITDQETVREYAEAIKAGSEFPPVVVFKEDAKTYWLADGFHTIAALALNQADTAKCAVRKGDRRAAWEFALGANAEHGKRRSNGDKRKAIGAALADNELVKWSDREIARITRTSPPLVAEVRRSLTERTYSEDTSNPSRTVRTRSGTVTQMSTGGIAQASKGRASGGERRYVPIDDDPDSVFAPRGGDDGDSGGQPAPPAPPDALDARSRPVPERFRPVFGDGSRQFGELLASIANVGRLVEALLQTPGGLPSYASPQRIQASLGQLKEEIKMAAPHSLCPLCAGKGCKGCKGLGWVNKLLYDAAGEEAVRMFESRQWPKGAGKKGGRS